MSPKHEWPHLYVIGEEGVPDGPVKIGITRSRRTSGLSSGNWRRLRVLCEHEVADEQLRWREWLIHRRLRHRHVRGEWFCVRKLVTDEWEHFLDSVFENTLDDLHSFSLVADGHELVAMRQRSPDRRWFEAVCSCGDVVPGDTGQALPTVQRTFAVDHLGLVSTSEVVRSLGRQVDRMDHGDIPDDFWDGRDRLPCAGGPCGHR